MKDQPSIITVGGLMMLNPEMSVEQVDTTLRELVRDRRELQQWREMSAGFVKEIGYADAATLHNPVDFLRGYIKMLEADHGEICKMQSQAQVVVNRVGELLDLPGDMTVAQVDEALSRVFAERDHWKANHDNQVALKRILMDRPDLKERAETVRLLIARAESAEALVALKDRALRKVGDNLHEITSYAENERTMSIAHGLGDEINDALRLTPESDLLKRAEDYLMRGAVMGCYYHEIKAAGLGMDIDSLALIEVMRDSKLKLEFDYEARGRFLMDRTGEFVATEQRLSSKIAKLIEAGDKMRYHLDCESAPPGCYKDVRAWDAAKTPEATP